MRRATVVQLSMACGIALIHGCGGKATGDGQPAGNAGEPSLLGGDAGETPLTGGTDSAGQAGAGEGIAGTGASGTGDGVGGAGGDECVEGTERCPCLADGTCHAGLVCASSLCVALGGGGQTGSGGSGGATGGGGRMGGAAGADIQGGAGGLAGSGGAAGGLGGAGGGLGGAGGGVVTGPAPLPCDVLEGAGHPCVAAHSTVRLLRTAYDGPLYQVCKGSATPGPSSCQGEALDVGAVTGGYADAAAQDVFCAGEPCAITTVYDQSGRDNHLEPSPPGGAKATPGDPANAGDLPVWINGHAVYGMLLRPGMGYRAGCDGCTVAAGNGTAVGDEPESIYMITSQHDLINGCCFDYGNAETTTYNDGNGAAEAVYFGMGVIWGTGSGEGPWVMADLENGLYPGWGTVSTNTSLPHDFVTGVLVGDTADKNAGKGRFALYGGDATSGPLTTLWDGIRPEKDGYVPMQKQGSVVLSISGDNSDGDGGRFYEGVMVTGAATVGTVDALEAAIVAARYGAMDIVDPVQGTGGAGGAGSDTGGAGGSSGSGGGPASCSYVTPCGGDLVGTWTVDASCLAVSGVLDLSSFGLGCSQASVTGTLGVTGTWTANADGTYADNTITTGQEQIHLAAECLSVASTAITCERVGGPLESLGYSAVSCTDAANGACSCAATVDQAGGIGLAPLYASTEGDFTTSGAELVITTGEQEYAYCVSGATLTLTPQSASRTGTLTGTVQLQQ